MIDPELFEIGRTYYIDGEAVVYKGIEPAADHVQLVFEYKNNKTWKEVLISDLNDVKIKK